MSVSRPEDFDERSYSVGFGEGWRTARGMDGIDDPWREMIERAATEMASWSGPVPSGVAGFRPYAEKVIRAALEMRPVSAGEAGQ